MSKLIRATALMALSVALVAAHRGTSEESVSKVYSVANQCFTVGAVGDGGFGWLVATDSGEAFAFSARARSRAGSFLLKPSRLGTYLFYDAEGFHLVSDGSALLRQKDLVSSFLDESTESNAEWILESVGRAPGERMRLRHLVSGRYVSNSGLVDDPRDASRILLLRRNGCAEFPEATLDATGRGRHVQFEDGSLFGFVDTHSHILSNLAFGSGGIFHGAPFHPLGVEHALPDCEQFHGADGRKDLFGFGFDNQNLNPLELLLAIFGGETPEPNHATAGWPEFTDWPNAPQSSTHQTQYYRWLERAYLGGLRLVVLHATSNQIICDLIAGSGAQPVRNSCNDMVAVDRILEGSFELQDYIDAQEGGPGKGWFRIVKSPEEARRQILDGKMAVILGIETSNLFDCFLVPSEEFPACTEQDVIEKLDYYHDLGVRVIFPVHKYDNGFSAGDGDRLIIELGNFIQTGHFSNFTTDCDTSINTTFDRGPAAFPGLNKPREIYMSPPPNDVSGFGDDPIGTMFPFVRRILKPGSGEDVCQKAGLTPLGEFLIEQLMLRGMIPEIDHLPRRSYKRAFEMLEANDYPAAGTHGLNNDGKLYALGGVSQTGFGRCRSATEAATMDDGFQRRVQQVRDAGGFPAEGFGFDLNGFAGAPGPRFGPGRCSDPQTDPVTYPFQSYAGDVTFHQPRLGNRSFDFNTQGMVHIGLVPELIEDVRRDGVTDEELEPLFKSAEGYIRMWEKAERRAAQLSSGE